VLFEFCKKHYNAYNENKMQKLCIRKYKQLVKTSTKQILRYLMELTIEQALQRGVAAHKEGKLQDAERLYRAILQSQPAHPDANHNLGVLAVSVNKADAALPLFKTALEANPKMEQFWLSYIDALIKTEKVDDARRVLSDAQQAGVTAAKLQIFEEQLEFELSPRSHIPQQEISNPLHSHQGELSAAIELREVGKYKEAQEWLSNVIEHDSRNTEALSLLSQVLLLDKKEAEAEKALTAAASINSELPSVYRNQARLLLKQSKTAEALEKAQLGCRQSPEDPESLLVLAACLGANQRDLEALPIIEKILKAESNYAEAYANRALIKLRAKDTVGAIEDAEMTVSLKPHLTQMWQLLGSLHYQANNLSDAIEALRRAHKNEPKNTAFMIQLGEFLRQDNKASEAITLLEQATELAPKDANVWTNLGVAFQQEKRIADAKIAYEKALALNPKSAAIASNLGTMAKEAEEWESALRYFEKALEIEPNLSEVHSNLGVTLQELGRLDEALASYTQAIALKPDFALAHYNLGNTLKELGRLDEAEASYNQAIALKPDFAGAHSNLGNTLKELGRLDEAEASLRQAIALKPDYAEARSNLGNTLKELGRLDEAEASYTQAIALKPDFAEAHYNLGVTLQELGRLDEALASYNQAIALKPDFADTLYNRSQLLFNKGQYEAALRDADACVLKKSRVRSLISLYALGRVSEIYKRLELLSKSDAENTSLAAFATFISEVEKKPTAYNFCPNPMDFIHIANLSSHVIDSVAYVEGIIGELNKIKTIWEPSRKTTVSGFQSLNGTNLFKNPAGKIAELETIIINEIEAYHSKFQNEQCSYIQKFPTTRNIFGWTVILKQQGHQNAHIHPSGWLSGVIYLKVVPSLGKDEGAIEFSLNSKHYHDVNSPSLTFQPEVGDIVFFPSSLHHRTIPFTTDADRIVVSFDLIPKAARH
jgi:uncharacterized protein (TIGR02466 family)